jgi:hypothetical protein
VFSGRDFLTEAEAAALLGVPAWKLRKMRLAGTSGIPYLVFPPRKVRYRLSDLLDKVKNR